MENEVVYSFLFFKLQVFIETQGVQWYSPQKVKQQEITAAPEFFHYTYRKVRRIESCIFFVRRFFCSSVHYYG